MTDLTASLKVTGTGFLAEPGTADLMTMLLAAAALFASQPENFPKFRCLVLGFADGSIAEHMAAIEPGFMALLSMALSPDGLHA